MIIHFRGIYEIVQGGTKMMVQYLASLDWTITFVPPCISFFFSKTIYAMSEYGKFQEIHLEIKMTGQILGHFLLSLR